MNKKPTLEDVIRCYIIGLYDILVAADALVHWHYFKDIESAKVFLEQMHVIKK